MRRGRTRSIKREEFSKLTTVSTLKRLSTAKMFEDMVLIIAENATVGEFAALLKKFKVSSYLIIAVNCSSKTFASLNNEEAPE